VRGEILRQQPFGAGRVTQLEQQPGLLQSQRIEIGLDAARGREVPPGGLEVAVPAVQITARHPQCRVVGLLRDLSIQQGDLFQQIGMRAGRPRQGEANEQQGEACSRLPRRLRRPA
jgi:hypothetical protein